MSRFVPMLGIAGCAFAGFVPGVAAQSTPASTTVPGPTTTAALASANGRLGNFVWFDANRDAVFDDGDSPMSGVTLELSATTVSGWRNLAAQSVAPIAVTTTDAQGGYSFDNLPYGAYTVTITGGLPSSIGTSYDIGVLGDLKAGATLTAGSPEDLRLDFGFYGSAKLCANGYEDANGNGTRDEDEPLVSGSDVIAIGPNGIVQSGVADGDLVCFENLPYGTYSLKVTDADGSRVMGETVELSDSSPESTTLLPFVKQSGLAFTGTTVMSLIALGAGCVVLGFGLVRRRSRS